MKTKAMTMCVVPNRFFLLVVAVAVFVLCPPLPARGEFIPYHFVPLAGISGPGFITTPAINISGEVAFNANSNDSSGLEAISKAAVGSIKPIVYDTTTHGHLDFHPTINYLGDVGFSGGHWFGQSYVARYTEATQGITTIVEGDESLTITLSRPINALLGGITTYTYTITDDDKITEPFTFKNNKVKINLAKGICKFTGTNFNMAYDEFDGVFYVRVYNEGDAVASYEAEIDVSDGGGIRS